MRSLGGERATVAARLIGEILVNAKSLRSSGLSQPIGAVTAAREWRTSDL
jgi:hypothetical protein